MCPHRVTALQPSWRELSWKQEQSQDCGSVRRFRARPVNCLKVVETIGFGLVIACRMPVRLTIARTAKSGSKRSLGSDPVVNVGDQRAPREEKEQKWWHYELP